MLLRDLLSLLRFKIKLNVDFELIRPRSSVNRTSDSGSESRGFESLRGRRKSFSNLILSDATEYVSLIPLHRKVQQGLQ